jgi:hypothetical protein
VSGFGVGPDLCRGSKGKRVFDASSEGGKHTMGFERCPINSFGKAERRVLQMGETKIRGRISILGISVGVRVVVKLRQEIPGIINSARSQVTKAAYVGNSGCKERLLLVNEDLQRLESVGKCEAMHGGRKVLKSTDVWARFWSMTKPSESDS